MLILAFFSLILLSPDLGARGFDEEISINSEYDRANHPGVFFDQYDASFAPSGEGRLSKMVPWSDSYWPRYSGGITYRWQTETRIFKRDLPVGKELSREEKRLLSPAEKFDLLMGNTGFNFSKRVLKENPESAPDWQGICDGWAEASIHFPPGAPKTFQTPEGEAIDFGASDINALLSYYHAKIKDSKARILGRRCDISWWGGRRGCDGMNPGAFHIVLVEALSRDQSFIVDIDEGLAVWNQPVYGFDYYASEERAPTANASEATVKEVLVHMELRYISEAGPSYATRLEPIVNRLPLRYWVELNEQDQIVGGSWHDNSLSKVDFAWYRPHQKLSAGFQKLIRR